MQSLLLNHAYLLILVVCGVLEAALGRVGSDKSDRNETLLDVVTIALPLVIRPMIYFVVVGLSLSLAPQAQNALKDWPWYAWLPLYLLGEDMLQYWWHRLGHTRYTWVWHRAHHSAPYMGARVTFRNGFLYSFFMPNVWTNVLFLFLGAGGFAAAYGLVKIFVIIGAHSETRWDQYLYRSKHLKPLAWILERTISTPATHFAHHALTEGDGIGHYNGNFGNLLFFWDVLFGTALIARKYPPSFGVEKDLVYGRERWWVQLLFPLFQSKREASDFNDPTLWFRSSSTQFPTAAE
jgi:sterol desaturase/sphingolipid hydroxylase (fatty acid hydroxylase superfamily)